MQEIWKDIPNYEGLYQISNLGRVKSLERIVKYNHSKFSQKGMKERILSTKILNGYLAATLYKNKKRKSFLIHRLVANAFIPNPNNYPQVNHKDENKFNNNALNLEWCTNEYNIHYGTGIQRCSIARFKPVCKYSLGGVPLEKYLSQSEAAIKNNVSQANISKCCNGRLKTYKGYIWKYEGE